MAEQRGNIAQFTSPIDTINPDKQGEAASQLSRSAGIEGGYYKQAGQDYRAAGKTLGDTINQHEYMTEVSQGSAAWSALYNNKTAEWNRSASESDPNDSTIGKKFLDDSLEPSLQQFQDGFSTEKGQEWAITQADKLRQHFYDTTSADMSHRAGEAKVEDFKTTLNQLSATVYRSPTSADTALAHVDDVLKATTENSDGRYTAEQISKFDSLASDMKNEIVKNQLKGLADNVDNPNGPAVAKALLDSGKYDQYIPASEQSSLHKYIDNQIDARGVEKEQKEQAAQTQQTQQNAQEVNSIFSQLASGKGYAATVALSNQKLSPQQRSDLVAQKTGILSLPQDFLTSPAYGDEFGKVSQSVYGGQPISAAALTAGVRRQEITPAGAVQIQALQDKMKTPEGLAEANAQNSVLTQMKSQIVKGGPNAYDPAGEKIYGNMLNSFYPAWDAGIKAGKTPAQLSDPNSKDYIGNLANTFKRSDTQALADVTSTPPKAAAVPPPDKRVVGQSYPTPLGDLKWLGGGWEKPKAATPAVPKPE